MTDTEETRLMYGINERLKDMTVRDYLAMLIYSHTISNHPNGVRWFLAKDAIDDANTFVEELYRGKP